MENLDDRFKLMEKVSSGGFSTTFAKTEDGRCALVHKFGSITGPTIQDFCSDHEARMLAWEAQITDGKGISEYDTEEQSGVKGKKRFLLLVYDLSDVSMFDYQTLIPAVADMKVRLRLIYRRALLCTMVIVKQSWALGILNMFLEMYQPARPVKVVEDSAAVRRNVETLWRGKPIT